MGWFWTGLAFQVLGLAVTGVGVVRTWSAFGVEPFFQPVRVAIRRSWVWVRSRWPGAKSTRSGGGTVAIVVGVDTMKGRGSLNPVAVSTELSVEEMIRELYRLIAEVWDRLADFRNQTDDRFGELERILDEKEQESSRRFEALEEVDRVVATGGLRLEAVGLLLVALGIVLQGIGTLTV